MKYIGTGSRNLNEEEGLYSLGVKRVRRLIDTNWSLDEGTYIYGHVNEGSCVLNATMRCAE